MPNIKGAAREYLEKNPNADIETVMKLTGSTRKQVHQAKGNIKARKAARKQVKRVSTEHSVIPQRLRIDLEIPPGGIMMKLKGKHVLGTIDITENGIAFRKANAKVKSDRVLTWRILKDLMNFGLFDE